jgi:hypothetical protein
MELNCSRRRCIFVFAALVAIMNHLPTFDIFSGESDRDALWVCAVSGLAAAKERMDSVAAMKPGSYFIFLAATHEIVARTNTSHRVPSKLESGAA